MKVLFTSPILENPAAGGPQLRIQNSIKALSQVCDLHIIHRAACLSPAVLHTDAYFSQYARGYKTLYAYPSLRILRFIVSRWRRARRFLVGDENDPQVNEIVNYITKENIDLVWFGYGNISYPLIKAIKTKLPSVKVVCDTDSVWSRFVLRELPYSTGARKDEIQKAGKLKEAEERAWVELCDVTTAVSKVDAAYYREIATDPERVHIFSNVIDVNDYKLVPDQPNGFKKPCLFLAGSYGPMSAMNMAADWVLDEVLPIVHETYPNLHLYLVGSNSDREFSHRVGKNVTVTGRLDSVLPYLCHANVALVPLKFESGTRFKILEAGACRTPLVSTTLGAEGIPVEDEKHILIADDPQDFARAIIRILDQPSIGETISGNCFDLVNENYSVKSLVSDARQILEYLKNG